MQALYSDQSYLTVHQQLRRRLAVLAVVSVLLLAVFVYAAVIRTEWLAMAAACVLGFFAIFFAEMFCLPLARYRRLIRTALHGRSHTRTMEFVRAEPDLSSVDGVSCRSLIFLGDPDKHGTREQMLYWDAEIPLPALTPGQEVTLQYTDRTIIALQTEAPSSPL